MSAFIKKPSNNAQTNSFPLASYSLDRLTLFAIFCAVVKLFHQFAFTVWFYNSKPGGWFLLLTAIALLLRPRSLPLLILLLLANSARVLYVMPNAPNHIWFETCVDITILFTLVFHVVQHYRRGGRMSNPDFREDVFKTFAPVARVSLFVLYFFAVFHKLNVDYLRVDISCGTALLKEIADRYHIDTPPVWARLLAIWGTLVLEAIIPLFLFFRPTRNWAIIIGILFHLFLALHPQAALFSFSSLLIGFYALFLPKEFPAYVVGLKASLKRKWQEKMGLGLIIQVGLVLLVFFTGFYAAYQINALEGTGLYLYLIWAVICLVVLIHFLLKVSVYSYDSPYFTTQAPLLWVLPVLLVVNGLSPFLDLKTETSFSMFSNLRTEAPLNNHLFMPRLIHLTGWQDDLVDITEASTPQLKTYKRRKQLVALFEVKRLVQEHQGDMELSFIHRNQAYHYVVKDGVSSGFDFGDPIHPLVRKFIFFRPVYKEGCLCQH